MAKKDAVIRASLKDDVTPGLQKIQKGVEGLGGAFTGIASKAGLIGGALASVAAAAGFGNVVGQAFELEAAMDRAAVATGATAEQLAQLEDRAQAAGERTGFSAVQAAEALTELGRSGLNATEAMSALQPVLALAKSESLGFAEASGLVADTLDQFGLGGEQASQVVDQLAVAAAEGGTKVAQLAQGLQQVGPIARNVGLSFSETAAALAQLAKNGFEGGKGGEALKAVLEQLQNPASRFSAELKKLGIDTRDFGSVLSGLEGAGRKSETALATLSGAGSNALRALLRDGGGALDELQGKIDGSAGAAQSAADKILGNVAGAFLQLKDTIVNVGTDFLRPIRDPLEQGIRDITAAVRQFAESEEFPKLQQAFADVFNEGIRFIREFLGEFDFKEALGSLSSFVTEAVSIFKDLRQNGETAANAIKVAFNGLQLAFNALELAISGAVGVLAKVSETVLTPLSAVSEEADKLRRAAQNLSADGFQRASAAASDFKGNVEDLGVAVKNQVDATVQQTDTAGRAADAQDDLADSAKKTADATNEAAGAARTSAEEGGRTIDVLVTQGQKLQALNEQLAQAEQRLQAAQIVGDPESIAKAAAGVEKVKAEISALTGAAQNAGPAMKQAFDGAATSAESFAGSASAATDAISETGPAASAAAGQAGDAIGGLTGLLTGLNAKYGAISEGAREFFVEAQKNAASAAIGIRGFGKSIEDADRATENALSSAQKFADGTIKRLEQLADAGAGAGQGIAGGLQRAEQELAALESGVKNTSGQFRLLDQATLSRLQQTIDATRAKVQQLSAEAKAAAEELASTNEELGVEAARRAGDEAAQIEAEYRRRLKNIEELEQKAGAAGLKDAAQARQRLRQQYEQDLREINERKAAEARAAKEGADARIAENERATSTIRATNAGGGGGSSQGATGGFQDSNAGGSAPRRTSGAGGTAAAAAGGGAININVSAPVADDAGVERLARLLFPTLQRLSARTR